MNTNEKRSKIWNSDSKSVHRNAESNREEFWTFSENNSKPSSSELMKRASTRRDVEERYFYMLTDGCGNEKCDNENCVSSGKIKPLSPCQASTLATHLLNRRARVCEPHARKLPRIKSPSMSLSNSELVLNSRNNNIYTTSYKFLTENVVRGIIDTCQNESRYSHLIKTLFEVFSKVDNLATSFLNIKNDVSTNSFTPNNDIGLDKETFRELEGELEKDVDCLQTMKSVDWSSDETQIDFFALRKAYQSVFELPSRVFEASLIRALKVLAETIEMELKVELKGKECNPEDFEKYVISFLIIFEMPPLTCPEYLNEVLPYLCKAMTCLPCTALARICRIWARYCRSNFKNILVMLHKVINCTIENNFGKIYLLQECSEIVSATKVMKVLFYANILAGSMESSLNTKDEDYEESEFDSTNVFGDIDFRYPLSHDSTNVFGDIDLRSSHSHDSINVFGDIDLRSPLSYDSTNVFRDIDLRYPLSHDSTNVFRDIDLRYPLSQEFRFIDALARELKIDLMNCIKPYIPFSEFYNEALSDAIEMDKDYTNYKNALRFETLGAFHFNDSIIAPDKCFSFMTNPFILTPATKTLGLFYDNRIRMYNERMRITLLQAISGEAPNPYLKLKVRRDHLIKDTLMRLELFCIESPHVFKKQLMIEFEGEQGMDEGGISKEFFQLIIEEIFNPDYGMFTVDADTGLSWFNTISFENDSQYTLIGLVLGLAIYNGVILDINFPMVVYKKLLGRKGTLNDLKEFNPVLHKSLKYLLEHEEDNIEDVYMQTFRVNYTNSFGSVEYHDLIPDGDKVTVNLYNKQKFVNLYVDFLLNKSIAKQFNAFRKGFRIVTDESPLKFLFRPEEIEMLVCGSKNFNLHELEKSTRYDGGYSSSSPVIRYFWNFAYSLSSANQRKLLQFATGSDRVPVGGLCQLHLIIARNGPDSDRLPTAHTCFNVLLLPEYCSHEKLSDRLMKAINYSKGFGMI